MARSNGRNGDKAPHREADKAPRARKAAAPAKTKTAVNLSDQAMRSLIAAAAHHQVDHSAIVEHLINETLSGYYTAVNGARLSLGKSSGQSDPSQGKESTGGENGVKSSVPTQAAGVPAVRAAAVAQPR